MTTPAPAPTPAPPPMPPEVAALITKSVKETVTEEFASRDATARNAPGPVTSQVKDLQMEPPDNRVYEARAGVAMKAAYLARAKTLGVHTQGEAHIQRGFKELEAYVTRCKSVGMFASLFGQGGEKLPVVESSELIEFLRRKSLLLDRPGLRRVSGYGGKFVIGKQNESPVVYWVAEGEPAAQSKKDAGLIELGAHKFMGRARISNDLLRRADSSAAADVGGDLQTEAALHVDKAGFFGKGNKTPRGILEQTDKGMFSDIAGITLQNKIDDLDALPAALEAKELDLDETAFYFMTPKTFWHLRGQRDNGTWVFDGLRDLKNPTINGFPVVRGTLLNDQRFFGFGLASQLYFGSAAEMSMTLGENASDFAEDMQTVRVVGYADWQLRHDIAFAFKKSVTY
ncbi:phage major capsid protein [Archangium lansingense]|uniref:phage major capsid protein n=1 Tax=Archangium lansingense TaxID=2995310 RepID=UPI003B7FBC4A